MAQVSIEKVADRRVAVTPSTHAALWDITGPGETLGDTIAKLIEEHHMRRLDKDLDEIDVVAQYTPWEQVKKDLGLLQGNPASRK
ncbi:MAG: hypothetical protein WC379_12650 [Methanoregula sp.]|jgi:hypothetical protein